MAWDKVCRPKHNGGLGLRKTAVVNQAFQCKLAWKILTNQNSVWVHIMRTKYLGQQDFFSAHAKPGDSVVWRNILKCPELIRKDICWTIGDGKDISFWQDNLIENTSLMYLLEIEDQDMVNFDLKVSDFIEHKQWNINKLTLYINNQDIVHKVIGTPIPVTTLKHSFFGA